ncbi:hypothetical protein CONLIGDRAFT_340223 [Coniochaeta ligniaria NRRL 30616]|uniref:Uncharacterized protein n=1 Tax=Coniochaeta ligniaria NRRL 30616 TaxID=1408157 RepID=A0A1J7J8R4_9PEZI|nr:hypothetical protein CONLIGDRAFT_340223 [Coniochaeta ligniaria NRRL 30616]
MASFILGQQTYSPSPTTQRTRNPQSVSILRSQPCPRGILRSRSLLLSRRPGKHINTGLSSRTNPTSLLLISSNLHFTHIIQSTSGSQPKTPINQHAFQADFHPQGPDQPRRLLRCHVNDPRSLPNGARAESTQALRPPASGTPSEANVPQQSHEHLPSLPSTFSAIKPTMSSQKQRNLVPSQMPGPPSLASRCTQPTSPQPQHASFGPPSSDSSLITTMAHCTLSGPSTAAQLRRIFHGPPSLHFPTVSRHHHTYITPTTTHFFSSPSSDPSRPACLPEPGFERDWPVPDDDVHYC